MKYIHIRFIFLALSVLLSATIAEAQETTVNEPDSLNIKDPQVQVAYKKVAKTDLLGGVAVVDLEELTKVNYNTYSLDNMQGYAPGFTGNSLWGMGEYLVLVDGVPRDANNVLPTEIEEVTFLKGASAVLLYGSRAAKGVIYIATKRGKDEDLNVAVRANTGWHVAKSFPKYLSSAEYMGLYNEALSNDGLDAMYSEEDIYNYGSGVNPYRYPNLDFYSSDYLTKSYNRTDVSTEISGGNERAKFYTNIGFYTEGDLINFGEGKENNKNRLNVRGNIDLKLNKSIKAHINANATYYNSKSANSSGDADYWSSAATLRPNRIAPLIPISYIDPNNMNSWNYINSSGGIIDGSYFLSGSESDQTNIFADYYAAGRSKWTSRQFQFDTGLEFDLKKLLSGLTFHTLFAVDYSTAYTTSFDNNYATYSTAWRNYNGVDNVELTRKHNNDEKSGEQNITGSSSRQTLLFSGWFEHQKSIDNTHHFSSMLLASGWQRKQSEEYHANSNANLGLQFGYNYKHKYYVDLGAALVYSAKLPEDNRSALSPTATIGWRISEEDFLANSSFLNELKLSVSGSILHSDLDIEDYYMYTANYNQSEGAWWGWQDGIAERSTNAVRGSNEELTYVKRKELSVNLEAALWNHLLDVNTSFFVNTTEGGLTEPVNTFPSYFSTGYPDASFNPLMINFNNDKRIGFDFSVTLNKNFGDLDLALGVVGTYYKTEATQRDERNEWDYQNRQGQPLDGIWGLQSLGLFQSEEEISSSPEQLFGGSVAPGDIKYVDQNNDGVIDNQDQVFLGKAGWSGDPFTGGVHMTVKYKNISLFALGTGSFGAYGMKNGQYFWVSGNDKYSELVRDRWTEATAANAAYPRLTTGAGTNNFRNSDYWLYKRDRFNLAKVQLTYDLPKQLLSNFILKDISAYVSGTNLLTLSKEREILEMNVGSAPQTRFFNLGVKAVF